MLYLPDANILIYSKMAGMQQHPAAHSWMNAALADPNATLLVCETTLLAFMRITTNKKIFAPPLGVDDARKFVSGLMKHPRVQFFRPTREHFDEVAALMRKHKFGGNLTMAAHLAAIARATGATVVTSDSNFRKIPYLNVTGPEI